MTLTFHMPAEVAHRLAIEAARRGVDPPTLVATIVEQSLATGPAAAPRWGPTPGEAIRAMFAEWAAEDATDDPAELDRRRQEFEEFKAGMNANALYGRPIYP